MKEVMKTLQMYYNAFIDQEKDWDFLMGLTDYVHFIESEKLFEEVTKKLSSKIVSDSKSRNKERDNLKKTLLKARKKLTGIVKCKKYSEYSYISCATDRLNSIKLKNYEDQIDFCKDLWEWIERVRLRLIKIKRKNPKDQKLLDEILKKISIPTYGELLTILYKIDKLSVHSAWLDIMGTTSMLCKGREIYWKSLKPGPKFQKNSEDYMLFLKEIDDIKKMYETGKKPHSSQLMCPPRKELRISARRVHLFLLKEIPKLQSDKLRKRIKTNIEEFNLKVKDREVLINNYLIARPFTNKTPFDFLECIIKKRPSTKITKDNLPEWYY